MRSFAVVKLHALSNTDLGLRAALSGVQADTLAFQGQAEPFDKVVFEEPALVIHQDTHTGSAQPVGPRKRRGSGN